MTRAARPPSVMLITDPRFTLERTVEVIHAAAQALGPGRLVVQLRDKSVDASGLASAARVLRAAAERAAALFVVNAATPVALQVARDAGADGVHVPCRRDALANAAMLFGASAWISAPAHADDDVTLAASAGATAVLVSPIFETPGKGPPRGVGALAAARSLAGDAVTIHALGGVVPATAAACAEAGADGVAVIRALIEAADPEAVARALDTPFQSRLAALPGG